MAKKFPELNVEALTKTGAVIGFLIWLLGLVWHGMMAQPSMMSAIYSGVPYMSGMMLGITFVWLVIGGAILGWLTATIYNHFS